MLKRTLCLKKKKSEAPEETLVTCPRESRAGSPSHSELGGSLLFSLGDPGPSRGTPVHIGLQRVVSTGKNRCMTSQVVLVVKNLPANAGDIRAVSLIPGSGRSPGGGHSSPLLYSCLRNPMDRGAWWPTVHGVRKSQTGLKGLSSHTP